MFVDDHHSEYFGDARSDELNSLIANYDSRIGEAGLTGTSSGVVYTDREEGSIGCVILPVYNLNRVSSGHLKGYLLKVHGVDINDDFTPNFLWITINLRRYRNAHKPFSEAFYTKHKVTLDSVLALITALSLRVIYSCQQNPGLFFHYFQRAYIIVDTELVKEDLLILLPQACETLGLNKSDVSDADFLDALNFWILNDSRRNDIGLAYPGPHYPFLPVSTGKVFIDYAWITQRLFDLFRHISLSDQSFQRGRSEKMIRSGPSALPIKPCKSFKGQKKQIDYAHECSSYLIIAECKAVGMSIGFDRGESDSIKFRTEEGY